jgi:hypothetical protein
VICASSPGPAESRLSRARASESPLGPPEHVRLRSRPHVKGPQPDNDCKAIRLFSVNVQLAARRHPNHRFRVAARFDPRTSRVSLEVQLVLGVARRDRHFQHAVASVLHHQTVLGAGDARRAHRHKSLGDLDKRLDLDASLRRARNRRVDR